MKTKIKIMNTIKATCKNKDHIKLTIGTLANGKKTITVFNQDGKIKNDNYIYEIGSISKTFTASLLAKEIYLGHMQLNDPINKYIKNLRPNITYPTLKQLATHTAGYPTHLPMTKLEYLSIIKDLMLHGAINKGLFPFDMDYAKMKQLIYDNPQKHTSYKWKYSNLGMAILGYCLGVSTGNGFNNSMDSFIKNDLALKNTFLGTDPNKNLHGYSKKNENFGNWQWGDDFSAPAGSISSCADDLLDYANFNINNTLPFLNMCHKTYAKAPGLCMGLGWLKTKKDVLLHAGGTGLFSTYLAFDKNSQVACTVLSNYIIDVTTLCNLIIKHLQNQEVL